MAGVSAIAWYKSAAPSSGPAVRRYPETAGQTFVKGDPVKLDSAGRVLLAVDTETGPWGIANAAASGTTDALVSITLLQATDIYSASASAAGATRTVTRSDVGLQCAWIKSTVSGETTKSVLDTSDNGTSDSFVIIDNLDAVGTVDGRYLFMLAHVPVARAA